MSAAEKLEMMRSYAPLAILICIAGIAGGVYLFHKCRSGSIGFYTGVALLSMCTACLISATPGLLILYSP